MMVADEGPGLRRGEMLMTKLIETNLFSKVLLKAQHAMHRFRLSLLLVYL